MKDRVYYCPECNEDVDTRIEERTELYSVRGDKIELKAAVRVCTKCNTPVYDENLDEKLLSGLYDEYRKKHKVITPAEVCEIRECYGLSQRGIAALLNWSPTTIARYETGALPDSAHMTTLLMLKNNKEYARQLFNRAKDKMGRLDRKRFEEALAGAIPDLSFDLGSILVQGYKKLALDYLGYTDFDPEKVSNMFLYFSSIHPKMPKAKILKLLFYADFTHYKKHGVSLSGMPYQHLPYGPVPYNHGLLLDYLTENKVVCIVPSDSWEGEYCEPLTEADLSIFDDEELETIHEVGEFFRGFNAKEISDFSYQEEAYAATQERDLISYKFGEKIRDL